MSVFQTIRPKYQTRQEISRPSVRTQTLGIEQAGSEAVASTPSSASAPPQNSVQAFARATQTARAKEGEHQQLRKDLQARINELSAATG
jgi:hypothetical protein